MKILFQGDSITDCGRDRKNPTDLGQGYPAFVSRALTRMYPDIEFEFVNRAIYGDKTRNLRRRWQEDCVDINPDIVSVLVGVNDTWHQADSGDWIENSIFEENYRFLLDEIKFNTGARIIMLEQYVLDVPDKQNFHPDIDEKIRIVRRLAREYASAYIPLDGIFASACVYNDISYWSEDGVHPTNEGQHLIEQYYLDAIIPIIEELADEAQ